MQASTVWTLPARWYADPEIYEAERRRIFSREWLWIGRETEVAEPGQYVTAAPAGFPLFVRRAEDGTLRAFHNVCRHRASKLLTEPSRHCNTIECPYHGWRYRSDGALDHVPLFGEAPADYGTQLAREDIGIVEVVQQNLNAGVYERGPLSPRHENGLLHFHEMVREAIGPAVEA